VKQINRLCSVVLTVGLACASTPLLPAQGAVAKPGSIKVIFDTDFSIPPQDDGLALMLALKSPELNILGITTVAGNDTMQRATSDALRELEIGGRTDIPVYRGANRPLVHQKSQWATTVHGKWWSDETPATPPGGFAKKQAEKESAVDFIIRTVNANPGQISILALGPLTNIATAIRQDPQFAHNVKQIAIMGGAIASLGEGGGGNVTPNAEFNIWVDPEAAWVVVHSGIPLVWTPLNVTHKTNFAKQYYDEIVAANTPLTNLIKERMAAGYEKNPKRQGAMYDELTVASLIDPSLVKTVDLYVDVIITHGPDYGTTVGAAKQWEGGEESVKTTIQCDVDFDRFIKMYIDRVKKP
jgi:inosine-uridine nucleoside N-ribohydrolase